MDSDGQPAHIGDGHVAPFSSQASIGGKVASGKSKVTTDLKDHAVADPETWTETITGRFWGITIRGYGAAFHEAGNSRYTMKVAYSDVPGEYPATEAFDFRWCGGSKFDVEALCAYFGYEAVFP